MTDLEDLTGGCDCGQMRYRMHRAPMFVNCCHCSWCQRETGSAFAVNAMIETDELTCTAGTPDLVETPSESGLGQQIARCPHCRVALWSHYASAGPIIAFVRVGTLDAPERCPPDAHIFTRSRLPWVPLPADVPAFEIFYEREKLWPAASLARRAALLPRIAAYRAQRGLPPL
ncbi:GFA family protein [Piscinibacterium candidicorallinum]|uniref:GFA family protein n=1 Tax=Piscinibacterium candidicorallinum TaxID=1793872 RepID=A0ABV7HAK7_9BURK